MRKKPPVLKKERGRFFEHGFEHGRERECRTKGGEPSVSESAAGSGEPGRSESAAQKHKSAAEESFRGAFLLR